MSEPSVLIIGGGVAGLSAACHARLNGFGAHIVEHNLELGGVCAAWSREPYVIDGCLRWLMGAAPGGMFRRIYEELGIVPEVELRTIETFARVEDPQANWSFEFNRDVDRMQRELGALGPEDLHEIAHLRTAIDHVAELQLPIDAPELTSLRERVASLWGMRHLAGSVVHFRGDVGTWLHERIRSPRLRAVFESIADPRMPAMFLPMLLGSLVRGQLAQPTGGTLAFRDALIRRFRELGGQATTHTTVDEILVAHDRAIGVRLGDGTIVHADAIISTASLPETAMRLLGGRYVDDATRHRIDDWATFDPVAIVSFGVAEDFPEITAPLAVRLREPLLVGDAPLHTLSIQVFRGPPFAPAGHAVVQSILPTRYAWWAEQGSRYGDAKTALADRVRARMEQRLPGLSAAVKMVDVVTPLTFWRHARSWRGAYEGFVPTPETFSTHVPKQLPGLANLWLAGQWVEPGGGLPPSLLSGRQAIQLLCHDRGIAFVPD